MTEMDETTVVMPELAYIRGLAEQNRKLMTIVLERFGREVFETDADARHIRLVVASLDADVAYIQAIILAHGAPGADDIERHAREQHRATREAAYEEIHGSPVPPEYVWPVPMPY